MKLKYLTIPLSIFLLCGCNSNQEDAIEPDPDPTPDVVSKRGESYTDEIIGNLKADIPYLECENFDLEVGKDDFGDPLVCIYVYCQEDQIDTKLLEYEQICYQEGYIVSLETNYGTADDGMTQIQYDVYYASKELDDIYGLEIQFLEGSHNNKECIGIFAYNYIVVNKNSWPTNLIKSYIGEDIPHFEDDGSYEYEATLYTDYVYVRIVNAKVEDEERYANLCLENGFSVSEPTYDEETGEYYGRLAYRKDKGYGIQFGYTANFGLEFLIYFIDTSIL